MAPWKMCETCTSISFRDLPSAHEDGLPHLPSFDALEQSAADCFLCAMLHWSLGCSFVDVGGLTQYGPRLTSPTGKELRTKWTISMYDRLRWRGMETGGMTLDFSSTKANLGIPPFIDPRQLVTDGSAVRPWLFGNWFESPLPIPKRLPLLVGLGVKLGSGPGLDEAIGLVETEKDDRTRIRFPGTFLRVRADEDARDASFIPGRLRADDQGSQLAFTRVKNWIQSCDRYHECSIGHSCKSDPGTPLLPTRVLHVGDRMSPYVCLVEPLGTRDHYIALSHCWGSSARLTTLKGNVQDHKRRIALNDLAHTFQDAILIARELEIQYVWIDSLCIVQDDFADWEREAVQMGGVYSNAYLTISALNSSDDAEGIFTNGPRRLLRPMVSSDTASTGRRCLEWAAPLKVQTVEDGELRRYYRQRRDMAVCDQQKTESAGPPRIYVTPEWMPTSAKRDEKDHEDPGLTIQYLIGEFGGNPDPFEDEPLSKRGWTLQERVLSRRILHYGSDELLWECQDVVLAEDGAIFQRTMDTRSDILNSRVLNVVDPFERDPDGYETPQQMGRDPWSRLVQEYCARSLTRPDDKLPALAGLASSIAARSGDTYHAGLWRRDIIAGLSWAVEVVELLHQCNDPEHDKAMPPPTKSVPVYPEKYRAPSWSWASFDAKIEFHWLRENEILAECVDVQTTPAGSDEFGMVSGGWVKLKAPLYRVRAAPKDENQRHQPNLFTFTREIEILSEGRGTKRGTATFDDAVKLPCLGVGLSEDSVLLVEPKKEHGLDFGVESGPETVLEERQEKERVGVPAFTRIGLAKFNFRFSATGWWSKEERRLSSEVDGESEDEDADGRERRMKKEREAVESDAEHYTDLALPEDAGQDESKPEEGVDGMFEQFSLRKEGREEKKGEDRRIQRKSESEDESDDRRDLRVVPDSDFDVRTRGDDEEMEESETKEEDDDDEEEEELWRGLWDMDMDMDTDMHLVNGSTRLVIIY